MISLSVLSAKRLWATLGVVSLALTGTSLTGASAAALTPDNNHAASTAATSTVTTSGVTDTAGSTPVGETPSLHSASDESVLDESDLTADNSSENPGSVGEDVNSPTPTQTPNTADTDVTDSTDTYTDTDADADSSDADSGDADSGDADSGDGSFGEGPAPLGARSTGDFQVRGTCASSYAGNELVVTSSGCTITTPTPTTTDHVTIDTTNGDVTLTLKDATIDHTTNSVDETPILITGTGTATLLLEGDNTAKAYKLGSRAGVEVETGAKLTIDSTTPGTSEGTLTAHGHRGAGIGGGNMADGSNITISGGTVTASSGGGAGIGGGVGGSGSNITIMGGTVDASSEFGAGVGGGDGGGDGSNITISGGTVNASSEFGAGVGGGHGGSGEHIEITGGSVDASSEYGAGVGGGGDGGGDGSHITISGGTVNASSHDGAGVGGGNGGLGSNNSVSGVSWRTPTVLKASSFSGAAVQGLSVDDAYAYRTTAAGAFTVANGGLVTLRDRFFEARVPVVPIDWDPGVAAWSSSGVPGLAALYCGVEDTTTPGVLDFTSIPSGRGLSGWTVEYGTSSVFVPTGHNICGSIPDDYTGKVQAIAVWSELVVTSSDNNGVSYVAGGEWKLDADGTREFTVTMAPGIAKAATDHVTIDTTNGDTSVVLTNTTIDRTTNSVNETPILIKGTGTATLLLEGDNTAKAHSYGSRAGVEVETAAKLIIDSTTPGTSEGTLTAPSAWGAGIGGGFDGSGSDITIMGGTIHASSEWGAGVGGGFDGSGSNITITGGTIHASSEYGAGVGGGYGRSGEHITISGGTVDASSEYGAGVGGGNGGGDGSDITISGGTVNASSEYGAGVGGGNGGLGSNNSVSGVSWRTPTVLKASSQYGVAVQGLSVDDTYAYRTTAAGAFTVANGGLVALGGGFFEARVPVAALSWGVGDGSWSTGSAPVLPTYCDAEGSTLAPTDSLVTAPVGKRLAGWSVDADGTPVGMVSSGDDVCSGVSDAARDVSVRAVFEFVPELAITDTASGNPVVGAFDAASGAWVLDAGGSYRVEMALGVSEATTNHVVVDTSGGDITITVEDVTIDHTTNSVGVAPILVTGTGTATLLLEGDNTAKAFEHGVRAGVEVEAGAKLIIDSATNSGSRRGTLSVIAHAGAGIGGGSGSPTGGIVIRGGSVEATSVSGAGMGGGAGAPGSHMRVEGGYVRASSDTGAGMGGGAGSTGSVDNLIVGDATDVASPVEVVASSVQGLAVEGGAAMVTAPVSDMIVAGVWDEPTPSVGATGSSVSLGGGGYARVITPIELFPLTYDVGEGHWDGGIPPVGLLTRISQWDTAVISAVPVAPPDFVFTGWQPSATTRTGVFSVISEVVMFLADVFASPTDLTLSGVNGPLTLTATYQRVRPTITTGSLPGGMVGEDYTQTLEATGDTPISWAVTSGSLPGGLNLDPVTGTISGTPTTTGDFGFTVEATDTNGSATKEYTITITPAPLPPVITTDSLPEASQDEPYEATLTATGDAPIRWSVVVGTLPEGLTLDTDTGVLSGTPTVAGDYRFTVEAANNAGSDSHEYVLTVTGVPVVPGVPPTITTDSLAEAAVGEDYTQTLTATGDTPITWAVTSGSLPDGLVLDPATGVISGVPTMAGDYTFTVEATNNAGSDSHEYVLTVTDVPVTPGVSPVITTELLPGGTVGEEYGHALEASGDTPITWSVIDGALPEGLTLDTDTGVLSGTPTVAGDYMFTVEATNNAGSDNHEYVITVVDVPVTPGVSPVITTELLPGGTVGEEYGHALEASGDTPITWSVIDGALPEGLTLDTDTGVLSGTPTVAGDYRFSVEATNNAGSDSHEYVLTVTGVPVVPGVPPTITTDSLADAAVGENYTQTLTATGDTPIRWSVVAGTLPEGLTLDTDTGVLSGTLTVAGDYRFTVEAANNAGSDSKPYVLTIVDTDVPIVPGTDNGQSGPSQSGGETTGNGVTGKELSTTGANTIPWILLSILIAATGSLLTATTRKKTQ